MDIGVIGQRQFGAGQWHVSNLVAQMDEEIVEKAANSR